MTQHMHIILIHVYNHCVYIYKQHAVILAHNQEFTLDTTINICGLMPTLSFLCF